MRSVKIEFTTNKINRKVSIIQTKETVSVLETMGSFTEVSTTEAITTKATTTTTTSTTSTTSNSISAVAETTNELSNANKAQEAASDQCIYVDSDNVLHIDTSLINISKEELAERLGASLPEPVDFPWYGTDLKNIDYTYQGIPLCFMFQYDTLVMIIYDTMTPFNYDTYDAASSFFQSGDLYGTSATILVDENCYLEMMEDFYAETGETCFHQRYVSYDMY